MAEEPDKRPQEPDLELPSLFGRGRKKKRQDQAAASTSSEEPVGGGDPVADGPATAGQGDPLAADPVPEPGVAIAPATGAAKRRPPVPPPTRGATPPARPVTDPPSRPAVDAVPEAAEPPVAAPQGAPSVAAATPPVTAPQPVREPEPAVKDAGTAEATAPLERLERLGGLERVERTGRLARLRRLRRRGSAGSATEDAAVRRVPEPTGATRVGPAPVSVSGAGEHRLEAATPSEEPARRRRPLARRPMPVIDPRLAALLTGAVVGLVGVVLGYLAGRGCEAARGVSTCGGLGILVLLVILAVQVVLGAALFKLWRISDPASTSFLGVGLATVFALLFLLGSLESASMIVVLPVVTALTFLVSWWVTTSFVDRPENY